MLLLELLRDAVEDGASDVHLVPGNPPVVRLHGELEVMDRAVLVAADVEHALAGCLTDLQLATLRREGDLDFALSAPGVGRFRINAHKQRGSFAVAVRHVPSLIPSLEALGLPQSVEHFTRLERGLVLVTGPTGSGKSTTLAAMIDRINREQAVHIITLEDPMEFTFRSGRALVEQREVGTDCVSFASALRTVVRQDPDIILVAELRDLETMATALSAAETGHLVFGTLHTTSAAGTIDRLIDVFPAAQQGQVRAQLADTLAGVISQQLLPRADGPGRIAALEILVGTRAIQRCIREEDNHLIPGLIETGRKYGMQTMQQAVAALQFGGMITADVARMAGAAIDRTEAIRSVHPALATT